MTAALIPMKWAEHLTHDDKERCVCCNRIINGKSRFQVEVINGGADVAAPGLGPDVDDGGYMGFYPVGATCAKTHFRGFATKVN